MARLEETLTNLDIYLGDACNLRCVHCPCWITEGAPRFDPDALEAHLFEAAEYVATRCPHFDKMMLIGGEPFIHEGMVQFLSKQRLDVCITVYTNFVWPDPAVSLPDNVFFLSSMDAPRQEIYGQLRRTRDFAYSQATMRERSKQLIHVDTTVSKGNVAHLDEILDLTEGYPCTHWFLPIDPRVLRHADRLAADPRLGTLTELKTARRTAERAKQIMLDDEDIRLVRDFYKHRGSRRTNDFETFLGIYLSGVKKFQSGPFEYRSDLEKVTVNMPSVGEQRCAGIRRYMEISFTTDGRFVPMIHCPELWDIFGTDRGPSQSSFQALMNWESETRQRSNCRTFCGRTQFLGLEEYEDTFRHVSTLTP
jgi:MoaA/NifB/PqqE/SkfB family radical SAM enzyme